MHIGIHLEDEESSFEQTDDRKLKVTVEGNGVFRTLDSGDLRREKPYLIEINTKQHIKALSKNKLTF